MKKLTSLSFAASYAATHDTSPSVARRRTVTLLTGIVRRLPLITPTQTPLPLIRVAGPFPAAPADSSRKGRSAVRQSPSALCPARDTTIRTARQVVVGRLASGQHIQISSDIAAFDERRD